MLAIACILDIFALKYFWINSDPPPGGLFLNLNKRASIDQVQH